VSGVSYRLAVGRHLRPEQGRCAMEWIAHLAGEEHSDRPACVSPAVAALARSWNDALEDAARQRLRPYLARMIGTAGDGRDDERMWLCTDWLARRSAPAFLALARLDDAADALRRAGPVRSGDDARRLDGSLEGARRQAGAARAAAEAEARSRRSPAGGDGALDAFREATRTAQRRGGLDAVRAAVRTTPHDPAQADAWAAAWRVSLDAMHAAARRAGTEAVGRLAPTVAELQASVFDLLDRLLPGHALALPPARPAAAAHAVA
jgi:hypothetical protein